MDPRLLTLYNRELMHLRGMGEEFAKAAPDVAQQLDLGRFKCEDPYVERLLEGFAFLTARIQLKLDAEFPRFTQHLLEMIYPGYLAPTPSMAIVSLAPDMTEGSLVDGYVVNRGTTLRSQVGKKGDTACEFGTSHDVALWPIEIIDAQYFTAAAGGGLADLAKLTTAKAGIRIRLRTAPGLTFDQLALDKLALHLRGSGSLPYQLYERIFASGVGVVVRSVGKNEPWKYVGAKQSIKRVGFGIDEGLLPSGPRSYHGYRLLEEYFAFRERFLFAEIAGLNPTLRQCKANEVDIAIMLDRSEAEFERAIGASNFALFCSPAINLFPKRADRIQISDRATEFQIIPDRTRPQDYEVYQVTGVQGHGSTAESDQPFESFYASNYAMDDAHGYYTVERSPRVLSQAQKKNASSADYAGSDTYIALVDSHHAPYRTSLKELSVTTLCTNRHLPSHLVAGSGKTDFSWDTAAPIKSVRIEVGPTQPVPSRGQGLVAWHLISYLTLNYLSLVDHENGKGAEATRDLLRLHCRSSDAVSLRQIDGVRSIASRPVTRRLPTSGPIAFGRGIEIALNCDEAAFEGAGVFLFGSVLEEFLAQFVSINCFTETVLKTNNREVMRWTARNGQRPTI
jgi:type VI secretion system protein ImpG